MLQLTHGATLSGHFVFEGSPEPPPPETHFQLMVQSGSLGAVVAGRPAEDGTFTMSGIESGRRRLLTSEAPGWILKGVFLNGADVSDEPLEFQDGAVIDNVSVVYTTVRSPLSIAVQHAEEGGSATVAVFPYDPATWHGASRRIKFQNAGAEPIIMNTLPPGDYLVVAIADAAPPSFSADDAKLLERVRPLADHVQLVEEAGASLRIRAVPFPR